MTKYIHWKEAIRLPLSNETRAIRFYNRSTYGGFRGKYAHLNGFTKKIKGRNYIDVAAYKKYLTLYQKDIDSRAVTVTRAVVNKHAFKMYEALKVFTKGLDIKNCSPSLRKIVELLKEIES